MKVRSSPWVVFGKWFAINGRTVSGGAVGIADGEVGECGDGEGPVADAFLDAGDDGGLKSFF